MPYTSDTSYASDVTSSTPPCSAPPPLAHPAAEPPSSQASPEGADRDNWLEDGDRQACHITIRRLAMRRHRPGQHTRSLHVPLCVLDMIGAWSHVHAGDA